MAFADALPSVSLANVLLLVAVAVLVLVKLRHIGQIAPSSQGKPPIIAQNMQEPVGSDTSDSGQHIAP